MFTLIDSYNIDINNIFTTEDLKKELKDKLYSQAGVNPDFSKEELHILEVSDPVFWNAITSKIQ